MKVAKNYLYNLVYEVLILLTPLILTPYVSRVLGAEGIGAYAVSSAVAGYFILVGALGLGTYGYREIAYVRDDAEKTRKTFWEIFLVKAGLVGISMIGYAIFVIVTETGARRVLYLSQEILILATLLDISWLFIGLEDFKKTTIRNIIVKILSVVLVFLLVKKADDLVIYTVIITGSSLGGQLIMWTAVPKHLRKFGVDSSRFSYHLKRTIRIWVPSLAIQIYASLDKVMLGYMDSEYQVGLYDNSQKIVRMASAVTTSLASVLVPRMSNLFASGNKEEFSAMAERALKFVTCLAFPMTAGIIAVRNTLVPWFYGPGFEPISTLLLLSAWLVITLSWSEILGRAVLLAVGKEKIYTSAVVTGAALNLILNILLIKPLQASGAIIASVSAEYAGMFIMMFYCRKYVHLTKAFKRLPLYALLSAIMTISCFFLGEWMGPSILSTMVQIVLGVIIYGAGLLLSKDENVVYLLGFVKRVLHRNA